MKPNDYLKKVLAQQTFADDDPEMKDLIKRRQDIEKRLRSHFSESNPSIRWAGSKAKKMRGRPGYRPILSAPQFWQWFGL